ncbi:MAG: hypothetical protein E3J86_13700 [Candidatus Thorarchaeota archaeon]|nr:MAG: hypothetical protein E3J86_13700 [Candidatus Thorarchaeota archaeon]
MDWRDRGIAGLTILLVCASGLNVVTALTLFEVPDDLNTGPYVDNIVYKVIPTQEQRIFALLDGEIEIDTGFFYPNNLGFLDIDEAIDFFSAFRNGYGHITINTGKYPLNVSAFRRAFAYAFDKTRVTSEIMDGFSREHDSLVPYVSGWCIEDDLEYHYYENQAEIGNQILDSAGFTIDAGTGYRLAPDNSTFDVVIEYASSSPEIAGGIAQIAVDALNDLHVDADRSAASFNEYVSRCGSFGGYISRCGGNVEYDMVFYATNFNSNDLEWLAYAYWSRSSDFPYQNPSNFRNATYDSWRDQLLFGTTYEEVHEAAAEIQKILHYNVPSLVVYENKYIQAYRNDQYKGHVGDLLKYITGHWTLRKIRKLDGTIGGTVPIAISREIETLNPFTGTSEIWRDVMDNLYSSLYRLDPAGHPIEDLATNYIIETHSDNLAIPEGHQRFTLDIIQNATWTDGQPLTANDVAYTFTYILESGVYGNPSVSQLAELYSAYTLGHNRVVLEFVSESYWHFNNFAFVKILPAHIFNNPRIIDYDEWASWNPGFNPAHPHVTSGPYIFAGYEFLDSYNLTKNPDYYRIPAEPEDPTTSSDTVPSTDPNNQWLGVVTVAISVASVEILLVFTVVAFRNYYRNRQQVRLAEEVRNRDWLTAVFG